MYQGDCNMLNDLNIILGLVHDQACWPCKALREGSQDYEARKRQMQTDAAERKYVIILLWNCLHFVLSVVLFWSSQCAAAPQHEEPIGQQLSSSAFVMRARGTKYYSMPAVPGATLYAAKKVGTF
jgi:hypothetical protein